MKKKILSVDDDNSVLKMLDLILDVHGYSVKTVSGGEWAMKAYEDEPFDLVLTDISMPGLDGNAIAGLIKSSESQTPVVALTGEQENVSDLFDRVLGKPFYTRDQINTIEELISI